MCVGGSAIARCGLAAGQYAVIGHECDLVVFLPELHAKAHVVVRVWVSVHGRSVLWGGVCANAADLNIVDEHRRISKWSF